MKKTILIAAVLLAACATTATMGYEGRTYSVYEYPDAKDKGTFPSYRIKQQPDGSMKVFKYGDPFQPVYKITPSGEIFKSTDPFQRVGNIKNAQPSDSEKKGVK